MVSVEVSEKTEQVNMRCVCGCDDGTQTTTEFTAGGLPISLVKNECVRCGGHITNIYVDNRHSGMLGKSGKWIPKDELDERSVELVKVLADIIPEDIRNRFSAKLNDYSDPIMGPVPLSVKFTIPITPDMIQGGVVGGKRHHLSTELEKKEINPNGKEPS